MEVVRPEDVVKVDPNPICQPRQNVEQHPVHVAARTTQCDRRKTLCRPLQDFEHLEIGSLQEVVTQVQPAGRSPIISHRGWGSTNVTSVPPPFARTARLQQEARAPAPISTTRFGFRFAQARSTHSVRIAENSVVPRKASGALAPRLRGWNVRQLFRVVRQAHQQLELLLDIPQHRSTSICASTVRFPKKRHLQRPVVAFGCTCQPRS